jgi:hypothetical protein
LLGIHRYSGVKIATGVVDTYKDFATGIDGTLPITKTKRAQYREFSKEIEVTNQATLTLQISVADPDPFFHFDADPGPTFHAYLDPTTHFLFHIWTLECSKMAL